MVTSGTRTPASYSLLEDIQETLTAMLEAVNGVVDMRNCLKDLQLTDLFMDERVYVDLFDKEV